MKAACIVKRLQGSFNAQELFSQLKRASPTGEELFFESTGGIGVIIASTALHIRCHGPRVTVAACHSSAAALIDAMADRLKVHQTSRSDLSLELNFVRCDDVDEEVRLLAQNPFTVLRSLLSLLKPLDDSEPFSVCVMGVLGFDHIDLFEQLPPIKPDEASFPTFDFWLADSMAIIEADGSLRLIAMAVSGSNPDLDHMHHHLARERLVELEKRFAEPSTLTASNPEIGRSDAQFEPDISDEDFETVVSTLKEHVLAGDIFQAVASRTFRAPCSSALDAFDELGATDPSAYRFFLSSDWGELFGASPEPAVRLVPYANENRVEVRPIAGTRPRGKSPDQDDRLRAELKLDEKEIAEHMMLVDLARNDVARICRPGSRRVSKLMEVSQFASVMHMVSTVEGELSIGLDALDALRACATPGTLSGAPKLKAIELLRRYEATPRGPYGGVVLWINADGAMESAIVIRSALVRDGVASVRAGAGVVYDSDPAAEAAETAHKARAVLRAIQSSEAAA